jgi:uncharacterized tellurite resistance protein B-like protein
MLESLKAFFNRHAAPAAGAVDAAQRLRVAACALLLEMAYADGTFSAVERERIEQALGGHFDLAADQVKELITIAEAERREAVDLHQFTSLIVRHYDEGQRYVLAELLWRVVLADGVLSNHEDYLLQKLGRLLDLRPGYLAGIRKQNPGSDFNPGGFPPA